MVADPGLEREAVRGLPRRPRLELEEVLRRVAWSPPLEFAPAEIDRAAATAVALVAARTEVVVLAGGAP